MRCTPYSCWVEVEAPREMKILLVEDEPFMALAVMWELERAGHEVIGPFADPNDAFAVCSREQPELALIDIHEGIDDDGLALAKRLHRHAAVPSLYLTGDPMIARSHADAALGALAKPFDPEDLVRSIDVALAVMQGEQPDPRHVPSSLEVFH